MYTDCPACKRQFRIHAQQLGAAYGLVKCGYCGKTFNALQRLHDKPMALPARPRQAAPEPQPPPPEPQFDIKTRTGAKAKIARPSEKAMPVTAPSSTTPNTKPRPTAGKIPPARATGKRAATDTTTGDAARQRIAPPAAGESLADEYEAMAALDLSTAERPGKSRLRRFFELMLLLLLLMVLTLQLAWFNRDWLLRQYPQFYPWAEALCAQLDCTVVRFKALAAIEVLNRDVRLHPRYQGALLVNATIVNTADYVQPFPVVQLTLFDTNGRAMAHRDFDPQDYLDDHYLQSRGMPPDAPIHFVLELSDFSTKAVGFEFNFK